MTMFDIIDAGNGRFIKAWKRGVQFEEAAVKQLINTARLSYVEPYVAAMPDAHWGNGSTVGSVIPSTEAICPAAVGVDIGCGMLAVKLGTADGTPLSVEAFHSNYLNIPMLIRAAIEKAVPSGRTNNGGPGDRGAWGVPPADVQAAWDTTFAVRYDELCAEYPGMRSKNTVNQFGTLGTGNHFVELSADEHGHVWLVIHSGSRGLGNRIGTYFTQVAKALCKQFAEELPDPDLAFLRRETPEFSAYVAAVKLAQEFAWDNRLMILAKAIQAVALVLSYGPVGPVDTVHCHHNYIAWETHFGQERMITRKGAVRAQVGDTGIIPGSMGAKSYIVEGLGSTDSFCSCSHGAGRAMSRGEARRTFTVADHIKATEGVECFKDNSVIDETPGAYKPIEAVMDAQTDLVRPVHILRQFLCVKGVS